MVRPSFVRASWGFIFFFLFLWCTYVTLKNYTDKEVYERMLFTAHRNIEALKEQIPAEDDTLAVSVARREKLPRIKRAPYGLDVYTLSDPEYDNITKFHVISHTHWDREWYLPFEQFRGRLVKLLDRILSQVGTDQTFQNFHLDGQMIPVDDYVQVRQHMLKTIVKANIQNKITLGPWFVQPDEHLVTAEGLVRNLMLGIRKAEEMGGSSYVGYVPDSFGHIGQLPQLLLEFDIDSAVSGRGVNSHSPSEMWWKGNDGSKVLFIYLRTWYCNALDMPTASMAMLPYFESKHEELKNARAQTSHLLLMNGCDHSAPDPRVSKAIVDVNKQFKKYNQSRIAIHSNLDDYVHLVRRELLRKNVSMETWTGEMREEVDNLANTLSTKITQKMMNWHVSTLLEKWTEPLEAINWNIQHRHYDAERIWYGWRMLMENHPHDSICSCSVSDVHQEVDVRFNKAKQVADQLANAAIVSLMEAIMKRIDFDGSIFLFNPSHVPRDREIVYVELADSYYGGDMELVCVDTDGNSVTAQSLYAYSHPRWTYDLPDIGFRNPYYKDTLKIALEVSVPPFGYSVYRCRIHPIIVEQPAPEPAPPSEPQGELGSETNPLPWTGSESAPVLDPVPPASEPAPVPEPVPPAAEPGPVAADGETPKAEEEEKADSKDDRVKRKRRRTLLELDGDAQEQQASDPNPPADPQPVPVDSIGTEAEPGGEAVDPATPADGANQEGALQLEEVPVEIPPSPSPSPSCSPPPIPPFMQNEYLIVRVEEGGTLSILHKESNHNYTGMNLIEDMDDAGNEYSFQPWGGDVHTDQSNTRVEQVKHFTTHSVIRTSTELHYNLHIKTTYLLARGSRRVDVRQEIDNKKYGHRVRAQFPFSGVTSIYADNQFELVRRTNSQRYHPQLKYILAYDEGLRKGLAIANKGLPEYNYDEDTLSITLVRGVGAMGDWGPFPVPSGQERGLITVEYSIIPFTAPRDRAEPLFALPDAEARKFNERIAVVPIRRYNGFFPDSLVDPSFSTIEELWAATETKRDPLMPTTPPEPRSRLPPEPAGEIMARSLIDIRPRHLVLSALKKAEDRSSLILRFFNPFDESVSAEVFLSSLIKFKHAYRVKMNEQRRHPPTPLPVVDNLDGSRLIQLYVGGKKVITLELAL